MHSVNHVPADSATVDMAARGPGIMLALLSCLPIAGTLLVAQVLPQIETAFQSTPNVRLQVSVALTLPALAIALTSWLGGWLADRIGKKSLLTGALLIYAVLGLAPLLLNSLSAIIAVRGGMGVAEGVIMTCSTALIGDLYSAERRENLLSLQTAIASVAAVVFAIIGGVLGTLGWRTPFAVYGIAFLFIPAVILMVPAIPVAARRAARTSGASDLPKAKLLIVCVITLLLSLGFYVAQIQLPFLLSAIGHSNPALIGGISAITNTAVVAGTICYGILRRYGRARVAALCFILLSIGLFTASQAHGLVELAVGLSIASFAGGIGLPTFLNAAMDLLTLEQRGVGTGFWQSSFWAGQFLSPVLVIAATSVSHGLQPAVAIASCVMLGALLLTPILRGAKMRVNI